jgi:hypothetical protein
MRLEMIFFHRGLFIVPRHIAQVIGIVESVRAMLVSMFHRRVIFVMDVTVFVYGFRMIAAAVLLRDQVRLCRTVIHHDRLDLVVTVGFVLAARFAASLVTALEMMRRFLALALIIAVDHLAIAVKFPVE